MDVNKRVSGRILLVLASCLLLAGFMLLLTRTITSEDEIILDETHGPGADTQTPHSTDARGRQSDVEAGMEELESNTLLQSNAHAAGATIDTREYPDRIMKYIRPSGGSIFLESYVLDRLSEDDLPHLSRALRDEAYAGQWGDVIFAICVLEEDARALATVQEFVSTPWDWRKSKYGGQSAERVIRAILSSIRYLAMTEPSLSGPFLEDAFTREGAERLLQEWKNAALPPGMPFDRALVDVIRYNAATGLLHTRSPELFRVVEDKFYELASLPPSERSDNSYTLEICRLHLGERDLYQEMGWEKGVTYIYSLDADASFYMGIFLMKKYVELEAQIAAGSVSRE